MQAKIVVGLAFGDEGKGLTTDFLASRHPKAIVVRFSGGHQAAHTVMTGGRKHVFSSFGSGTFRGVPSYFSEYCTVHPGFLFTEWKALQSQGVQPTLFLHPLAKLTTPFDVWYNRGNSVNLKHGTCGKGVGATMKRNEGPYKLYAVDLLAPEAMLQQKLYAIANYYGITPDEDLQADLDYYLEAIRTLDWNIANYEMLLDFDTILFEGSQGILLDMEHGVFPNVTYAHTTSKNAITICQHLNIRDLETYYVTRNYLTRHGAGWMSNEKALPLKNTEEETCVYNTWQKELRVGELDYELLNYALQVDAIYNSASRKNLVVTCLDQWEQPFEPEKLNSSFEMILGSYSPDSATMQEIFQQVGG